MSTTRQITLTENPDGRWTAYDTATETVTDGNTRHDALNNLDVTIGEETNESDTPPAAPLYDLIGLVDEEEGERLRERSREFRKEFDDRVERTCRELPNKE